MMWSRCSLLLLVGLWVMEAARNNGTSPSTSLAQSKDEENGGCPELRSKRYISDGKCSSAHPIIEVVCVDWYAGSPRAEKKRCVDGDWHRRRVELLCHDGTRRFYHVRVVKSCRRQEVRRGQGRSRRLKHKRKPQ